MNNLFLGYTSKYSGAFDLAESFKYPRMCAQESMNLTDGMKYYLAQKETPYNIGKQSDAGDVPKKMDRGTVWLFMNGTNAEGVLGRYDRYDKGGTFQIQTGSEDAVGRIGTILRGCSRYNKLLELYLYVEVMNNNYPDFITDL